MAVVNLPDSPANGTTQTVGGITYTYNSSKGYWTAASSGGGGGGGASVTTDDSAPGSPSDGDLWYDTDDGGMFVYYQDTDSSQWVEVIGSAGSDGADGADGAAGADGSATVVADTTALLAISSPSAGDQVYVTANNTLYFYNGSGWYKIALINTNPTISGVSSSYALAIDGTATTVTITASDPEGLPITYSIASDTSGNIATVAQGTGASTNVFTVTPSTNSAHAGSFTLTFRASDGVNFATAPAAFTLQFSVVNSKYTTALITSVGANNAVNNSFDDKSTNDHTITAVGNATQTTFSPYRHGGYSAYFDGNGDYLQTNTNYTCSGEFTLEFWMHSSAYETSGGANSRVFSSVGGSNAANNFQLIIGKSSDSGSTGGSIDIWTNAYTAQGTTNVSNAEWHHIAVTRNSSNVMTLYIDGTSNVTGTNTTAFSFSNSRIATRDATNDATSKFNGYIRDLRLVEGTAVYTSNFTPPTEPLTAITNTKLLACHLPYIADGSTTGHAITVNGNTKTVPFAPYDAQEYSASSHGGSMYFDGTGDRLTFSHASDFTFGTGDLTIEFWIKTPTNAITGGYSRTICEIGQLHIYMRITAYHGGVDSAIRVYDETGDNDVGNVAISDDRWHHVVVVRESGTMKCWVDGKYNTGVSNTRNLSETGTNAIGGRTDGNGHMEGSLANLRVVKGTAVYTGTSNFTPPTAPLTAITNTSLLLNGTDAGIIDKAQGIKDFRLTGNLKSSTTQSKYLSSSLYFDGSGDYMRATNNEGLFDLGFNGDPFTIEWWQWWPTIQDTKSLGPQTGGGFGGWNGSTGHQLTLFTYSSSATLFYQWWNGSGRTDYEFNHGGAITASTWQHWATVYDGTNFSTYIDGTRIGHRTSGNTFGSVSTKYIILGASVDLQNQTEIYYSDVRITKGLARYSGTSFTVPSAALQG